MISVKEAKKRIADAVQDHKVKELPLFVVF
jgi:hypothetical protein